MIEHIKQQRHQMVIVWEASLLAYASHHCAGKCCSSNGFSPIDSISTKRKHIRPIYKNNLFKTNAWKLDSATGRQIQVIKGLLWEQKLLDMQKKKYNFSKFHVKKYELNMTFVSSQKQKTFNASLLDVQAFYILFLLKEAQKLQW